MHLPYEYHGAPQRIAGPYVLVSSSLPITFYHEFLKGKPLILGICMIVAAVIQIVLGIWLFFVFISLSVISGIVYWAPIYYIITGSLMIAGAKEASLCLVNSSMILNILNSVFSFIALVLACLDVAYLYYYAPPYYRNPYFPLSLILISDLLFLSTSIISAVFAGSSMRHVPRIPQACQYQGTEMVSSAPPAPAPAPQQMGQYGNQHLSMP